MFKRPPKNMARPLSIGMTMVLDRLYGLVEEEFEQIESYVDIVEIGWGLPLVWPEDALAARIKYYKKFGIKVSMSGTLLEYSYFQNSYKQMVKKARSLGFEVLEISDGIIDLTQEEKALLSKEARSDGFDFLYTVGKKDPGNQLSTEETLSQIEGGLSLDPLKVVIEGRERGRGVGIYDDAGDIRWKTLRSIRTRFDYKQLIFEAPSETQQAKLISELGSDVNLGNVPLSSVAALQSERLGLRFDTFGVDAPTGEPKGGPSTKFVLFVVRQYQPIDQREIASMTQLPRRTIQKALEYLKMNKLVTEHPNFDDRRSKIYRTPGVVRVRREA